MKSMREFLLEQPQLVKKELIVKDMDDNIYTSSEALQREYEFLFELMGVKFFKDKIGMSHIRGYTPDSTGNNLIFRINFYKYNHHKLLFLGKKLLQVNLVSTTKKYRNSGIATAVYKKLVDMGYNVVSDHVQYLGVQGVWRKLAKDRNYKITVYDIGKSSYIPDGEPVVYDGHNIPDEMIWDEKDFAKNILMILSK